MLSWIIFRGFFVDLQPDDVLGDLWEKYSRAVAAVQLHAQKIAGRRIPPLIFDPSALDPPLDLPVINFTRVNFPADVPVPRLVEDAVSNAKTRLAELGLVHESSYITVDENSTAPLNTVIAQDPLPGTLVQPGARVRLTQNVKAGSTDRFLYWKVRDMTTFANLIRQGG